MNKPLTPQQKTIFAFIKNFISNKGYSPTLEEIRSFIGVRAINTIVDHLKAIEQKGYISRRKHAKRNIEIRGSNQAEFRTFSVPVKASVGCDDLSVVADEKHDEFLEVDQKIIGNNNQNVIAVRAIGNSMNDAGIENGDYVLVRLTGIAQEGDRVVAVVGDMVTVKRLGRKDNLIVLWPESKDSKYKPIILNEDFKIAGKVICTIPGDSMDPTEIVYDKNPLYYNLAT